MKNQIKEIINRYIDLIGENQENRVYSLLLIALSVMFFRAAIYFFYSQEQARWIELIAMNIVIVVLLLLMSAILSIIIVMFIIFLVENRDKN